MFCLVLVALRFFVSFIGAGYKFLVDFFHLSKSLDFLASLQNFFMAFRVSFLQLNCDGERIISFFKQLAAAKIY